MIGRFVPQMKGCDQQDSQEFLAFLLDGLHEDLNKVKKKVYIEENESYRDDRQGADLAWRNHLKRNDSIIVSYFQVHVHVVYSTVTLYSSTVICIYMYQLYNPRDFLPSLNCYHRHMYCYLLKGLLHLLQGMFRSSIKCNGCGKSSVTFEPFMYLSLPIPPGQGVWTLEVSVC